ncbi:MAG: NFACT RNA binding domain-containing protein [Candidatus Pacearchaeota archaeon]
MICPSCKKQTLTSDLGAISGKWICKNCGYSGPIALEPEQKFRRFLTSNGVVVLCGKSAEQNELLIKDFTAPNELVVHTALPGSPFCVLKTEKPRLKDIKEAASICACFSKQWKAKKSSACVHVFYGRDIYKEKGMPLGTFGVKKIAKEMNVKLELYVNVNKSNKLFVAPYKSKVIAILKPGKLTREQVVKEILRFSGLEIENPELIPNNAAIIKKGEKKEEKKKEKRKNSKK